MPKVTLNGVDYLATAITEYQVNPLSGPIRTTGVQQRSDNFKVNRYVMGWQKGLFWASQKRESGRGVGGVRDADAETRWDKMTLPLNPQSVSADLYSSDGENFHGGYANFNSGLWAGIHSTNTSGNPGRVGLVQYGASSDDWTAGNVDILNIAADDDDSARVFATVVHAGKVYVLFGHDDATAGTERYYIYSSTDGATFADASGTPHAPFTTDLITTAALGGNDWRAQYGAAISFGVHLGVAVKELAAADSGSTDQFLFHSTTDEGTSWRSVSASIPSSSNQIKMHIWQDFLTSGFPAIPVAVLNEGIYQIDYPGNTFALIRPLNGATGDGLASTVALGDGRLYVGTADGNITAYGIDGIGSISTEDIGPASYGDGPIEARRGYATFIYGGHPSGLFVGYGGNAANKTASIFYYRFVDRTWHSIYLDTTANREITQIHLSAADDGTMRLHFNTEGSTDDVAQMIEEPLVGVTAGATQQYRTTGFAEFPDDDLGDPHTNAAILLALVDEGGTLGAATTNDYAELKYGLDGEGWEDTTLGNFLSSALTQSFGTSGRGVSGKKIQVRLNLFGDDAANTNTPEIAEFEVQSRNRVTDLQGWKITIDLKDSADLLESGDKTSETVLTNLNTVRDLVTLAPFLIGANAEVEVEMTNASRVIELIEAGGGDGKSLGQRTGVAQISLEEVL